jgi:capsular polysaccharide biosynthesis protein
LISELDKLEASGEGRIIHGEQNHSCDPLILLLRNGRALLRPSDAAYFSESGKLVGDGLSSFFRGENDDYDELKQHPFYRQKVFSAHFEWLPKPARIDGVAFVLHSPWSHNNYYHFMVDLAPRLMLLKQAGLEDADITVVAPKPVKGYQREVFDRLSIAAMWFNADQPFHIQAAQLLVVAQRRSKQSVSNVSLRNLKLLIPHQTGADGCCGPEKIFIMRGGDAARRLVNEGQLAEMLRSAGFASVRLEELSFMVRD